MIEALISVKTGMAAVLLAAAQLCTVSSVDTALPAFVDVAAEHPYYQAIQYCHEAGIVSGVGNNRFAPDNDIGKAEFYTICMKVYGAAPLETTTGNWEQDAYQQAVASGLATVTEVNYTECTWLYVLETLMKEHGLPAYSCRLWQDEEQYLELTVPERNVLSSARHYGLLDGIDLQTADARTRPTRGEIMQVILNLQTNEKMQALPEIVEEFPVSFEGGTEGQANEVYSSLMAVPKVYRDAFRENGWTFRVGTTDVSDLRPEYSEYLTATGITGTNMKEIYVQSGPRGVDGRTVRHEFGHFAMRAVVHEELPDDIFLKEQKAIEENVREYAATSATEAYADIFAYCCLYRNDKEQLAILEKAVPECYRFVWDNYFASL